MKLTFLRCGTLMLETHRYVNDNFDPAKLNATFEKNKVTRRATLMATQRIQAGEEIYASYGESYWKARGIDPETGKPLPAPAPAGAPSASDLRGRCALKSAVSPPTYS